MSSSLGLLRLGIDLMGADVPPRHILEAVTTLSQEFYSDLALVLFGTEEVMHLLHYFGKSIPNITLRVCPDVVQMDENPLRAVREKQESSLFVAIQSLKNGHIDALLTCSSTGAIVAAARHMCDFFPSISRPALLTEFPTHEGHIAMLDVGGNIESTSNSLVQFAYLGAAYARVVQGIQMPKVALLNIGEESLKGTDELKSAWRKLHDMPKRPFEFVGNKEPQDVFSRQADVFVSAGFTGNIFLKTAEAVSAYVLSTVHKKYPSILPRELLDEGHGAIFLGVKQLIVKCHGSASATSLQRALQHTKQLLNQNSLPRIEEYLANYLP